MVTLPLCNSHQQYQSAVVEHNGRPVFQLESSLLLQPAALPILEIFMERKPTSFSFGVYALCTCVTTQSLFLDNLSHKKSDQKSQSIGVSSGQTMCVVQGSRDRSNQTPEIQKKQILSGQYLNTFGH